MKLTTKQLKQIIKEELNEMIGSESIAIDHGEKLKLARFISTPNPEQIGTALGLADDMELISGVEYEEDILPGAPVVEHAWRFNVLDTPFMDELERQYKQRPSQLNSFGARNEDGLTITYHRDRSVCEVKLTEYYT